MMDKTQQKKSSGVLMHLSSLPSEYGIGSMGAPARKFVDFLKKAGQTYWQMLPICPTSYGDSPYQSFSAYAGNPYFIDLEMLESAGYLEAEDYKTVDWESAPDHVIMGHCIRSDIRSSEKQSEGFRRLHRTTMRRFAGKMIIGFMTMLPLWH